MKLILLVFAFVCFVLSAVGIAEPYRVRLIGAGLAFLTASMLPIP